MALRLYDLKVFNKGACKLLFNDVDTVQIGVYCITKRHNTTLSLNFEGFGLQTLKDWTPVEDRTAHEDHSIARDGGWRGIVNVVDLKDDLTVGRHRDPVSVGQGQGLVVIEDGIEVLDPNSVDWTVQNEPDVVTLKTVIQSIF